MQVFPSLDVVTLPPEGDESLPLGDTTKNFIRDEIETQLAQAVDKFNPHGARKVAYFLREWGLAGTLVAVPIALLALAGAGWYYAFNRVDKEARFQTTTENRLKAIEDQLKEIRGDLAKQSMINQAALPLADFKTSLHEVASAAATLRKQDVKIPAAVMNSLTQKLVAIDVNTPDYWATVSEVVSYKSSSTASWRTAWNRRLPNCTDSPPKPMVITQVISGTQLTVKPGEYTDCVFTLDSSSDNDQVNSFLTSGTPRITFRHCLIVYRGGIIKLILSLGLKNTTYQITCPHSPCPSDNRGTISMEEGPTLQFQDSLFDFEFHTAPAQRGQDLSRLLLARNDADITIPVSTHS